MTEDTQAAQRRPRRESSPLALATVNALALGPVPVEAVRGFAPVDLAYDLAGSMVGRAGDTGSTAWERAQGFAQAMLTYRPLPVR